VPFGHRAAESRAWSRQKEPVMLMAHPTVLRGLIEQYEALALLHAEAGDAGARQRMADVSYTLCVSTGTRDIDEALATARRRVF
jgi:hypothetical protein